jgi:23S rRNA pseudouridine1911/1915/1917 synthase
VKEPGVTILRTTAEHAGRRLDAVLGEWLEARLGRSLSKSAVRRVIIAGTVREAGRPQRGPGLVLRAGQTLEVSVDPSRLEVPLRRQDRGFEVTAAAILFEDASLIAVDKPSGLPTVPTADPARPSLVRAVEAYLAKSVAPRHLGVHQRLDRETSGVVLFVKDPRANAGLAESFAKHRIEKTYHALTAQPRSRPLPRWRCTRPIGTQNAITEFSLVEVLERALLVEARPRTGRKHQIRLHLAGAGMPVLGDALHGPKAASSGSAAPRLMLHASRLALPHPLTGAPLVIESPWPEDFRRELEARRVRAKTPAGPLRRS